MGLALTIALFHLLGSVLTAPRSLPEAKLVAGWGAACVVLTLWAVATPLSLRYPLAALAVVAVLCLAVPHLRRRIGPLAGIWRMLVLTLPLWLVVLPLRPSQIDTWLNLLPNAAYLFDHGMLPADLRPASYSFLPGAPYNTQFAAFIASVASGSFAEGAMGLFNIALQCMAALLLARVVAGQGDEGTVAPPWWACAAGFLLAVPLNPGYVPRVFFAPYGEAPLAVATMLAVWLAAGTIDELSRGVAWPRRAGALALVLAAAVNIKQSGMGLVAPVGLIMLVQALAHPRTPRRRSVAVVVATFVPAVVLYLVWRGYVLENFAVGELKLLPLSAWNIGLLPQIFLGMLKAMVEPLTYFIFIAVLLVLAIRQLRRDAWSKEGLVLGLCAGMIVLFNGFLVFTYVAHFPPSWAVRAHSYFRYESQLSLMVMLGLVVALRPVVVDRILRLGSTARARLAAGAMALVVALPIALVGLLRFDLATPMPQVWALGHHVARHIRPGGKLALLLPGDIDDSVGSMLRGVIMFTPPRRPDLDLRIETKADSATLDEVAAAGYPLALISCTPAGLSGVPPHVAALMEHRADGWRLVDAWRYPPDIATRHFTSLARGPLCGNPQRG
jgi:hypothetical protein